MGIEIGHSFLQKNFYEKKNAFKYYSYIKSSLFHTFTSVSLSTMVWISTIFFSFSWFALSSFYSPFPLHFFTADCQRTVGKVSSAIGVKAATLAILYETDHRPNNPLTLSLVSSFCPGRRLFLEATESSEVLSLFIFPTKI